eukprot:TRINITY_DN6464_c0_g2_i2.p1 TRINITY_DN6464_c0_g2~~TRINITY_DN6464_c0_g2_i2.p1  ORF type:complete len:635 (-),score=204.55 TRINITY_DN6464_c0_g2_i2:36-1940(-)
MCIRDRYMRNEVLLANCIPKGDAKFLRALNDKMRSEVTQLRAANDSFRELYEAAVHQVKVLKMTNERRLGETEALEIAIKDLQSNSDEKVLIGKLHHQLLFLKYNEGVLGKKYEASLDELRRKNKELVSLENRTQIKENEWIEMTDLFVERVRVLERTMNEMRGKIQPTLTQARFEEQAKRLREISDMKSELETRHRLLRDKNFELTLLVDYYENYKQTLQDLEERLKKASADDLSDQLIELSKRNSQIKLAELKAKREAAMSKEKEEFHQRVSRQQTSTVKILEEQVANWELKFAEREDFWRKKHMDALSLLNLKADVRSEDQDGAILDRQKTIADLENEKLPAQRMNREERPRSDKLGHATKAAESRPATKETRSKDKETLEELRRKYEELDEEYKQKVEEVLNLSKKINILEKMGPGTRADEYTRFMKDQHDQDMKKLADSAKNTIHTLKLVIDDLNQSLRRKDEAIEQLRQETIVQKELDSREIARLANILHEQQNNVIGDIAKVLATDHMGLPLNNKVSDVTMKEIYQVLLDKDIEISKLEKEAKALFQLRVKNEERIKELIRELNEVKAELTEEKNRDDIRRLMKDNEQLQKLMKVKNGELEACKKSIQTLIDAVSYTHLTLPTIYSV